MMRILFVCMGNICRSPTAVGVMRARLAEAGLSEVIEVDGAGTHAYHVGEPPDLRSQRAARSRGIDLSGLRARQVLPADFERYDWVLAADLRNLAALGSLRPDGARARLALILEPLGDDRELPDPYYGDSGGFERVLDLCEQACDAWIERLRPLAC